MHKCGDVSPEFSDENEEYVSYSVSYCKCCFFKDCLYAKTSGFTFQDTV